MTAISVALVNALPGHAGEAAERRFTALLAETAGSLKLRTHLLRPTGVARIAGDDRYLSTEALPTLRPDALLVTGAEPQTRDLRDEAFWPALAGVFEWAEGNAISLLASCLSAHALALHADGIGRRRLPEKCFGVFNHSILTPHRLTAGLPAHLAVPHSRWNDLSESTLRDHGYDVLIGCGAAGVHVFAKQRGCLMVGVQGHPEYAADTLWGEYRRDMLRFLGGQQPALPRWPRGCVPGTVQEQLVAFSQRAATERRPELMADFPAPPVSGAPWRDAAVALFGNWLRHVAAVKAQRQVAARSVPPIRVPAAATLPPLSVAAGAAQQHADASRRLHEMFFGAP